MGYDRNPEVLFQVLAKLCEEREGFRQNLRLQLVGQVDQSVMDGCRAYGLEGQVVLMGNVPRQAALDLTRSSPILLLLLNQQSNAEGRIPGKLFEYLAARRPILCLQPVQSDVADILTETGAGTACLYEDADAIKAALLELYAKYEAGQLQSPVDADVEAYSIRRLTGEMAGLLEGMI
jgi:hypothetical protein